MYVDAAETRRAEERGREYSTVGDDDGRVELLRGEERERLFRLYLRRLSDVEAEREGVLLHGRRLHLGAAPRRPVGLRPDGDDLVPVLDATPQSRHGRLGRAH